MTQYLGIRFEERYRNPGKEPFRYDYPTVGVGRQRLWRMTDVAGRVHVEADRLLELLRVEDAPYVHEHIRHDRRDSFRLVHYEVAELRSICDRLATEIDRAVDLESVRAAALEGDSRDDIGPAREDALAVYDRACDVVEVCDAGLRLGVQLEVY